MGKKKNVQMSIHIILSICKKILEKKWEVQTYLLERELTEKVITTKLSNGKFRQS